MYGLVEGALGAARFNVKGPDGVTRIAKVRGQMRRRKYIRKGDLVIMCLRDFETRAADSEKEAGHADIIHAYAQHWASRRSAS